jgi:hypothetical protein
LINVFEKQKPNINPNQSIGFTSIDKEVVATKGVKLRNKKMEQKEKEKQERQVLEEKFNKKADEFIANYNETEKKVIKAVSRFIEIVKDKTLVENKGGIAQDIEREGRENLLQLAIELNNSEIEEESGRGSIVILASLMKVVLLMRDRINSLEYELLQIKKELSKNDS